MFRARAAIPCAGATGVSLSGSSSLKGLSAGSCLLLLTTRAPLICDVVAEYIIVEAAECVVDAIVFPDALLQQIRDGLLPGPAVADGASRLVAVLDCGPIKLALQNRRRVVLRDDRHDASCSCLRCNAASSNSAL